MICPNCGSNMSDKRKRCERCGTDLTIYKKVLRASNLYYNNGLARAKVRDLSGAIIALRKSLDLNKLNTNARNLIGLVYYEMGETVAALSEWVISKHFQPLNNDADEYIGKVQSSLTRLDSLNQAIKRYNTALGMAKQGSNDLAIIQLKKVVSLNVNFIRAYQLLALLLIKNGEKEKARKYLQKASRIDVSNTTTLQYLRELDAPASTNRDMDYNPEAEQNTTGAIMSISSYREDKPNVMVFVNLVIGIIIGIAVMSFLVIPTIKNNQSSDSNTNYGDTGYSLAQIQEKDKTISTLQSDKEQLEQELQELQNQLDNNDSATGETGIIDTLLEAIGLYLVELDKPKSERDLTSVADQLVAMADTQFENEVATGLYNRLKEATFLSAAASHYEKGHVFYSSEKYQEALTELQLAMTLDPTDVDAIYFMARAYHRLEDKPNAALYYNRVITEFPDSNRITDAKEFLKQVQE